MIREIITDPEILSQKSEKVEKAEAAEIIKDLIDTAEAHPNAVGLSAIQIGIPKNVFIIKGRNKQWRAFLNPMPLIKVKKAVKISCEESCLSVDGDYLVPRYDRIDIIYTNDKFQIVKNHFIGFEAEIIQHEFDHLKGKCISDVGTRITNEGDN